MATGQEGETKVAHRHAGTGHPAGWTEIDVEFTQDPESQTCTYRIPSLHVTGVAKSEAAVPKFPQESITYALESPECRSSRI